MATTSDLRTGMIIRYNGTLHRVIEFQHVSPGNWRAFVRVKLKNIDSGRVIEDRLRAGEGIDIVTVDKRPMQYLYKDGELYYLMDTETFEQITVAEEVIGDRVEFLKENDIVDVLFFDGDKIMGIEVQLFVVLRVTEAGVAVRGDTATNVDKPVTLETGAVIQAPAFISDGDLLKIDTRTRTYIERVKE